MDWKITILQHTKAAAKRYRAGHKIVFGDCTILVYPLCIMVYSNGLEFWGDTVEEAQAQAVRHFGRFFHALEGRLGMILVKDRAENIQLVTAEVAETENGLARTYRLARQKLQITDNGGKVWLIADFSKGVDELETIGPTAAEDMAALRPHLLEMRQNPGMMTLGELIRHVSSIGAVTVHMARMFGIPTEGEAIQPESERPDYVG